MTKSLAALLIAGLVVVACGDTLVPTGSPPAPVGLGSASPPIPTGSAPPSAPSPASSGTDPTSTTGPPAATPPPPSAPTATPTATATPTPAPPLSEFPQSWTGTWEDPETGGSGSLELTLLSRGTGFGGSITMDGTACLQNGIISGTYDGSDIEFSVGQRDVEIRFAGTADDATMAGTFMTDCDAMDGTWQLTRSER